MHYPKMRPHSGGGPLHVVVIGRVSTLTQDIGNIEAGYLYAEEVLDDIEGLDRAEIIVRRFGEQGSGMLVGRLTINEAFELIESGWAHLVLMEDVSKSYRNPRWIYAFVQDCVDLDVRVIARGDGLDTYDENWEVVLASAAMRHGLHIPDTRRRIRRTSSKGFDDGGMVMRVQFGWRKLSKEEAASGLVGPKGLRMARIPELTPIFEEVRRKVVEDHMGLAQLADWLQYEACDGAGIKPGSYVKSGKWSNRLLRYLLRDPLCYGLRQFPKVMHEPRFSDGKHNRRKNESPPSNYYPELAHMTKAQWEEMNAVLDELGRKKTFQRGADHSRYRVARRKSVTPLQHMTCFACEGFYYSRGKNSVKCKHALKHQPGAYWNHVQVSCERVRIELINILLRRLDSNPKAMAALLDAAWEQIERLSGRLNRARADVEREIADLQNQADRLTAAIAQGGQLESLVARLKVIEKARKVAGKKLLEVEEAAPDSKHPRSRAQLQVEPREALQELARTSFEFGDLMRKVFPTLVIQPVQALDSGLVRPRAIMTLDLAALLPPGTEITKCPPAEQLAVNLFDPPVHIQHLQAEETSSIDILGEELGIGRMTVMRAVDYHKLMLAAGLNEPYRVLSVAPAQASRWNPRKYRAHRAVA